MALTTQFSGYKIQKKIGEGGMASVFLAMQESLNRAVALKILKKFDTEEQITRFFNEGKIIASLKHPNIITIHDLGEVKGRCFLAMEYIDGGDLTQYINKGLEPDEIIQLIKLIANCLEFVHQKGIVHRDIKPENILFRKDGSPVLTDFGVAKQIQTDTSLTMDGMTIGSPHYISPEQAEHKQLDARTDIYSLGIILYEMLTGQKPFQGNSPIEIIIAHLTTEAEPLPKHLERYQELLDIMIAKDAVDRFNSAADLTDFLGKLQCSTPTTLHALTKKLNKVISSTEKHTKHSVNNSLSKKKFVAPVKSQHKWLWPGIILTVILLFFIYNVTFQNKQPPIQQISSFDLASEKNSHINSNAASTNDGNIQLLLIQAEIILDDKNLTLSKLKQAYDAYNLVLNLDSNNTIALHGINHIATLYMNVQDEISFNLAAAEKALRSFKLTTPEKDNALFYFQETLRLDPNNPKAQQGKTRIANAYADLVEINLNAFEYNKAKSYLYKGLAIQPTSSRLLALEKQTNVFKDAPKRVFNKFKSIFD